MADETAETKRDWEVIQENVDIDRTERLFIGRGYLYRTIVFGPNGSTVSMVFVQGAQRPDLRAK